MSANKPVFVLVPGSFTTPAWYQKVTPFLKEAGYEWVNAPLPSSNSEGKYKVPPTVQDDAASIKSVITGVVDSGKEVVLVMHSYGGFPGTEATEGLGKADLQRQGKKGGVVALVYVAAWMPPVGKSIFTLQGEPEMLKNAGEYTYMPGGEFYKYLFPDLPEEEAKNYTALLENHSSASWHGVVTYPAYKFIPTTCVIPDQDFIIATDIQKGQVAREDAEGVKITVHELKGVGHSPMVSIPERMAEILISTTKTS
ncbi:alpha/beta-hydrolase [Stipitochalara longipes BDJ]|nr:alpha/beta-hydrolase [Stipitochalara longipes BDJ]